MRFERKYIFNEYSIDNIKNRIKSLGFKCAFPSRQVNSIYYDSNDYYLYNISEAGISDRTKIRIRWYNFNDEKQLEYKIKQAEIGKKTNYKNLKEDSNFLPLEFNLPSNILKTKINIPQIIDQVFSPKVCITYKRDYFISNSESTRITLDYKINYSRVIKTIDHYRLSNYFPAENAVMELKYDYLSNNSLLIDRVVNNLSAQITRFSKYCQAIKLIYN